MNFLLAWLSCRKGATAIEYAMIAGLISILLIAAIFAFGDSLGQMVEWMETILEDAVSGDGEE